MEDPKGNGDGLRQVFVGAMPRDGVPDVFGAHVGLTLADLENLRFVRDMLEADMGVAISLTTALQTVIAVAFTEARKECRRRGKLPPSRS